MSRYEKGYEVELNFDSEFERSYERDPFLSSDEEISESRKAAPVARDVDKAGEHVEDFVSLSLPELKEKISNHLVPLDQLRPPPGLPTGIDVIDDFLLWNGIPQGDLTLFTGQPGSGATSLWLQTVAKVQEQKKWAAWINSDVELLPTALVQKKINLQKLLVVRKPEENSQLFWILQEMISSSLFELIGCHLAEGSLKNHQLQKLKKLARAHHVALVFISYSPNPSSFALFNLVIDCQSDYFTVKRASHRPTPFTIPGGLIHADLMSQLAADSRSLLR